MNSETLTTSWVSHATHNLLDDMRQAHESILKNTGSRSPFDRIACTQAFFDRLSRWAVGVPEDVLTHPMVANVMGLPIAVRPDADVHPRGWQPERRGKNPGEWEVIPV